MRENKLRLNHDKTKILMKGPNLAARRGYTLMFNRVALTLKDQVCSLGVLLDTVWLLDKQGAAMARSAFHQLQLVC